MRLTVTCAGARAAIVDGGPKFVPLCARNWETIAELRKQAGDDAGFDTAEKWLPKCHVQGVNRF